MHLETMIAEARAKKDPNAEGLTRLRDAGFTTEEEIYEVLGVEEVLPADPKPKKKSKK